MGIDVRSWLRAGLAAGAIMLLSGVALGHIGLGREYLEEFRAMVPNPATAWTVVKHTVIRLGFGLLAIFVYTALRARYGPGPRTALRAGVVIYLAAYLPLTLSLSEFGILTGRRLAISLIWSLAEAILATQAGARLYREGRRGAS